MKLQEQVIKVFLYLAREYWNRTEEEDRMRGERKGEKRSGVKEGGAGLYISISTREKC